MVKTDQKKHKTPEERFLEVAPMRVTRVINAINSLSKCSSRNYKYSDSQVRKMFGAIKSALKDCELKYQNKGKNGAPKFRF